MRRAYITDNDARAQLYLGQPEEQSLYYLTAGMEHHLSGVSVCIGTELVAVVPDRSAGSDNNHLCLLDQEEAEKMR